MAETSMLRVRGRAGLASRGRPLSRDERAHQVGELRVNMLLEDGPGVAPQVVFRPRYVYPTLAIIRAVLACEDLNVD